MQGLGKYSEYEFCLYAAMDCLPSNRLECLMVFDASYALQRPMGVVGLGPYIDEDSDPEFFDFRPVKPSDMVCLTDGQDDDFVPARPEMRALGRNGVTGPCHSRFQHDEMLKYLDSPAVAWNARKRVWAWIPDFEFGPYGDQVWALHAREQAAYDELLARSHAEEENYRGGYDGEEMNKIHHKMMNHPEIRGKFQTFFETKGHCFTFAKLLKLYHMGHDMADKNPTPFSNYQLQSKPAAQRKYCQDLHIPLLELPFAYNPRGDAHALKADDYHAAGCEPAVFCSRDEADEEGAIFRAVHTKPIVCPTGFPTNKDRNFPQGRPAGYRKPQDAHKHHTFTVHLAGYYDAEQVVERAQYKHGLTRPFLRAADNWGPQYDEPAMWALRCPELKTTKVPWPIYRDAFQHPNRRVANEYERPMSRTWFDVAAVEEWLPPNMIALPAINRTREASGRAPYANDGEAFDDFRLTHGCDSTCPLHKPTGRVDSRGQRIECECRWSNDKRHGASYGGSECQVHPGYPTDLIECTCSFHKMVCGDEHLYHFTGYANGVDVMSPWKDNNNWRRPGKDGGDSDGDSDIAGIEMPRGSGKTGKKLGKTPDGEGYRNFDSAVRTEGALAAAGSGVQQAPKRRRGAGGSAPRTPAGVCVTDPPAAAAGAPTPPAGAEGIDVDDDAQDRALDVDLFDYIDDSQFPS
eukprot:gene533-20726_t